MHSKHLLALKLKATVLPKPLTKALREAVSILLASVKDRRTYIVEKMSSVKIQQTQGLKRDNASGAVKS